MLAHPGYRSIPRPIFPLKSEVAVKEYDTLARMLFDAGRLTGNHHRALSSYAKQVDVMTIAEELSQPLRASWFSNLDKLRKELKLDDLDQPIAAAAHAPVNRFARVGFANRR